MQERKTIEWSRDLRPEEAWDAYRRALHEKLLAILTPARIRYEQAPGAKS